MLLRNNRAAGQINGYRQFGADLIPPFIYDILYYFLTFS